MSQRLRQQIRKGGAEETRQREYAWMEPSTCEATCDGDRINARIRGLHALLVCSLVACLRPILPRRPVSYQDIYLRFELGKDGVDSIYETIDNHLVDLAGMKGSRYLKTFASEVEQSARAAAHPGHCRRAAVTVCMIMAVMIQGTLPFCPDGRPTSRCESAPNSRCSAFDHIL